MFRRSRLIHCWTNCRLIVWFWFCFNFALLLRWFRYDTCLFKKMKINHQINSCFHFKPFIRINRMAYFPCQTHTKRCGKENNPYCKIWDFARGTIHTALTTFYKKQSNFVFFFFFHPVLCNFQDYSIFIHIELGESVREARRTPGKKQKHPWKANISTF